MFLSGSKIKKIGANFLLILTTFFWGITFVVVKDAISHVDVFVFLAQRFLLAFILLLILWPMLRRPFSLYTLKRGGLPGIMLFGGFTFQTIALLYTSASNTAFLTGLNVVFVPLISTLTFGQKIIILLL